VECKICGNKNNNRHHQPKEMMLGIRDRHDYLECGECGCLQVGTLPNNLAEYYPENYYSYHKNEYQHPVKKQLIQLRDKFAVTGQCVLGQLISIIYPESKLASLQRLKITKQSRIMDVGCGAGNLLHSLAEIGFKQLLGIDPFNQKDIAYENGLKIKKQSIHEAKGQWDVIMFHHSFEHVYDQHEVLDKVHSLLTQEGCCLIRIPTVSSYAWVHYGLDWVQLDAPRHLFLHSIKSMQYLAKQHGFTLEHVHYDSNALQFWGSEQYQQNIPLRDSKSYADNKENSPFSEKQIQEFEKRAKELNAHQQGDQAAFYLRKK
jgi:2-polyprenyl-3-methyl-5-hydroxy-6-metoxy-1,4-benzoquinol methylase